MKTRVLFFLMVGFFAASATASNGQGAGSHAASLLSSQTGVRAAAMGGAFTAVADDVSALYNNPAGLGTLRNIEISAFSQSLGDDEDHRHLALAFPFGQATSSNISNFGTLAGSIEQFDYGTLEGRDGAGARTENFDAKDLLWTVGYGKGFGGRIFAGVVVKRYKIEIADQEASGTALDLGLIGKISSRWAVGASVRNQGSDVQFVRENEELPRAISGGVAFMPIADVLTFALDVEKPEFDDAHAQAGVEWWANRTIALRGGYNAADAVDGGFSAGIGFRIIEFEAYFFPIRSLMLDYTFLPGVSISGVADDAIESRHHFALSMRFGDR